MKDSGSVSSIIDTWPSVAEFARDIGIGYEAAKQMRRRNSIQVKYWPALIAAAASRGSTITEADLVAAHIAAEAESHRPFPTNEAAEATP